MDRITVNKNTADSLARSRKPSELCDSSGRVLGYFRPAADLRIHDETDIPVTEEELDHRSKTEGGRTLAEIMADLEKRQ